MLYTCKCGRTKSGSPWKAAGTRPWLCDRCAPGRRLSEPPRLQQEKPVQYGQTVSKRMVGLRLVSPRGGNR
jgi:hypothetical protein